LFSKMERKLWILRRHGGWIVVGFPMAAVVVADGEFRSEAEGAGGVAPADGCSTTTHLVLRDECLLRLFTKPSRDGALSALGKVVSGCGGSRVCSAAVGAGDQGKHRDQGLVCNFYFF
jgi:hypothetical protein